MCSRARVVLLVLVIILIASRSHAAPRIDWGVAYRASAVAAGAAHGADLATTEYCLGISDQAVRDGRPPVCSEMNPYLARFKSPIAFGAAKMGLAAVSQVLAWRLARAGHPRIAVALNVAQTVGLFAVASHNYRVARGR